MYVGGGVDVIEDSEVVAGMIAEIIAGDVVESGWPA